MSLPPRAVHLLNDLALGGVTKALSLYDHARLRRLVSSRTVSLDPTWRVAPRLDADFILTHFPPSWRTLPFLVSLRVRNPRARIIHVAHSYTRAWEAAQVPHRARFRAMLTLAFGFVDTVVAVSQAQGAWLAEAAGLRRDRLRVISPWSGVTGLEALPAPATSPGDRIVLGAYGRFDPAKGFDVLIDAMAALDPQRFTLRLGGFGPEEQALRDRARGASNITFVGRIDDVPGFIKGCDVIVVPSRWDSFGLVATEARFAGRPIVTADVDGLPEQVGAAGLVADCTTAAGLARALSRLPDLDLGQMGRAGRASVHGYEAARLRDWQWLFRVAGGSFGDPAD
jgi:glycosyltransferase involved in cell wall biosynthesis